MADRKTPIRNTTEWESDIQPYAVMRACPACGRHMRIRGVRVKEPHKPAEISYYAECPNRCARKRPGFDSLPTPLRFVRAETADQRLVCGVKADVTATFDAWNTWVDAHQDEVTPTGPSSELKVWKGMASCPVCHKEIGTLEPFQQGWKMRLGCPDHPTVASIPRWGDYRDRDGMKNLIKLTNMWADWLSDHRCPVCGSEAILSLDAVTGIWVCHCLCDDPYTCPSDVPSDLQVPVERDAWNLPKVNSDGNSPAMVIRDWRARCAKRADIRRRNGERIAENRAELDAIEKELSEADNPTAAD